MAKKWLERLEAWWRIELVHTESALQMSAPLPMSTSRNFVDSSSQGEHAHTMIAVIPD